MVNAIVNYLRDISQEEFRRIISDKIWVDYPSYKDTRSKEELEDVYESEELSWNWYGAIITSAISRLIYMDKEFAKFIAKHGRGLMLKVLIQNAHGPTLIMASKRGLRSKDCGVRKASVKHVSLSSSKKLLNDPVASVRKSAIKRIGIANCYPDFIDDVSMEIRSSAILAAPLHLIDYKPILDEAANKIKSGKSLKWVEGRVVRNILSKMQKDDIIHYLNLSGNDSGINEILEHKFQISWGDNGD